MLLSFRARLRSIPFVADGSSTLSSLSSVSIGLLSRANVLLHDPLLVACVLSSLMCSTPVYLLLSIERRSFLVLRHVVNCYMEVPRSPSHQARS